MFRKRGGSLMEVPRQKPLARSIRDLYRVEALEPRILLSADPALGGAHAVLAKDPMEQSAAVETAEYRDLQDLKAATQVATIEQTRIPDRQGASDFLVDVRALDAAMGAVSAELPVSPFAANDPAAFDAGAAVADDDTDNVVQLDLSALDSANYADWAEESSPWWSVDADGADQVSDAPADDDASARLFDAADLGAFEPAGEALRVAPGETLGGSGRPRLRHRQRRHGQPRLLPRCAGCGRRLHAGGRR